MVKRFYLTKKRGVDLVSDAVKTTLGPRGRNIALDKQFGALTITHNGVMVAKEITLKDPFENIGARVLVKVATKTNEVAGDGTTTATVLATMMALKAESIQPVIQAYLLGDTMILVDDQPLALGQGRPREALAYLLLHPNGVSRLELSRALWGDDNCESDALSRIIYRLRVALPAGAVLTVNRDRYSIDRQVVRVELDVERFEQLCRVGSTQQDDPTQLEALLAAIACYNGPFFSSVESRWVLELRERLRRRFQIVLRQAATISERMGRDVETLDLYHRLVRLDSTSVAAHTGIMRCHLALNEPGQVVVQYRQLTKTLDEELGISLQADSEPEEIYQSVLLG